MKQLCDQHDISDLNEIFSSEQSGINKPNPFMPAPLGAPPADVIPLLNTPRKGSRGSGGAGGGSGSGSRSGAGSRQGSHGGGGGHKRSISKQRTRSGDIGIPETILSEGPVIAHDPKDIPDLTNKDKSATYPITSPRLSFVKPFLMYPSETTFTVLSRHSEGENWFQTLLDQLYTKSSAFNRDLIQLILLNNSNLHTSSSILRNLLDSVILPLIYKRNDDTNTEYTERQHEKLDLMLYLIIILEVLPHLLLIKASADINLLKNLRLNLLHLINNFNVEVRNINSHLFPLSNSTIFLIILKKLINLNDLLITFIKLISKNSSRSLMSSDIENFLKMSSQTMKFEDNSTNNNPLNFFFNLNTTSMGEVNFNFKNDILSNDLIYTLIGYNYDPKVNDELKSSISMNFINDEINIVDEFFKNDLLMFLTSDYDYGDDDSESHNRRESQALHEETETEETQADSLPFQTGVSLNAPASQDSSSAETVLTIAEMNKLNSLIGLIDKKLLSTHFKSRYPILIYNNYIAYILNDILKYIFLKQQQSQLQLQHWKRLNEHMGGSGVGGVGSSSSGGGGGNGADGGNSSTDPHGSSQQQSGHGGGENSFGNWWVFNSFIQEYMSLMGEIVGLRDCINQ